MRLLTLFLTGFLATSAVAQENSERLEAARAYVASEGQQALMDEMLSPEAVVERIGITGSDLPEEKKKALTAIVTEEMSAVRVKVEQAVASGMAEAFTLEEINALVAFYSSKEGASAMKKMNPFMAQTMQSLSPEFQQMQANLGRRIQEEMSK